MSTRHDAAMAVALEHVRWQRGRGATPADIVATLPQRLRPAASEPSWDDVVAAIARAWLDLRVW